KTPSGQALQKAFQAEAVLPGRTGEQGQVTVAVAVIFVQVKVADGNLIGQFVHEPQVIIAGRGAEVGVTEIKTHPDVGDRTARGVVQRREEPVNIVRAGVNGVFQDEFHTGFGAHQQSRAEDFRKMFDARAAVQVQVKHPGADLDGEFQRAVKPVV